MFAHYWFSSLYTRWFTQVLMVIGWVLFAMWVAPELVIAQANGSFPVAVTVPVSGAIESGGEVITYQERTGQYALSQFRSDPNVYGVTVERPPVLFDTGEDAIPVITTGAVYLFVNDSTGLIERGDLLVTAAERGVAARALPDDEQVFAIALENADVGRSTILVQFDERAAQALREQRREQAAAAELAAPGLGGDGSGERVGEAEVEPERGFLLQLIDDYARATVAALIAVGSLFFVMYTFRSAIVNAILAVGRNPRARNAIMTVSIENILFALLICAIAIFVAIAVLVLPV